MTGCINEEENVMVLIRLARGVLALVVLVAMLVGLPWLLVALVGNPLPAGGWAEARLVTNDTIIGLLAALAWFFWAQMSLCTIWEVQARIVQQRPAGRIALAAASQQQLVATLVGWVLAIGLGSTALAAAAPTAASAEVATGPVAASTATPTMADQAVTRLTATRRAKSMTADRHIVEPGEYLSQIALDELGDGTRWPELYAHNKAVIGPDPDQIFPGQVLRIPGHDRGSATQPTRIDSAARGDVHDRMPAAEPTEAPPSEPDQRRPSLEVVPPAPETSSTTSGEVDEPSSVPDATSHTDDDGGLTALRALLATAACLSGGALALLVASRRRQAWACRPGRTMAPTPVELRPTERAVVDAGLEHMETVEFIDLALRHLAACHAVADQPLPPIGAVTLDEHQLTLLFTDPATRRAPAGWDTSEDGSSWTLPRNTILEAELAQQAAPYPALVSVGTDEDGRLWMLDMESVGVFGVAGPDPQVEDLIRYLVSELALNPWARGTQVMLADPAATQLVDLNPDRLRVVDIATAITQGMRVTRDTDAGADNLGLDLLDFRRDNLVIDSTHPLVIVLPGSGPNALTEQIRGRDRSRVVVVHADDDPVLEVAADGRAYLTGWDVILTPFMLTAEQAATMAALQAATARLDDVAMPPATDDTALGRLGTLDGALRPEFTDPRRTASEDPSSLLPEPDEVYLATTATTTEDLTALAPSVSDEVRAKVEALDPTLDADVDAWFDPDNRRPRVRVLGPVGVDAWGPEAARIRNLGGTTEFIVYVASRDHAVTPEKAAADIGWGNDTVHNRASDARRLLGVRPDGDPWLWDAPASPTARQRGVAAYELHHEVLVDADLFRRFRTRAQARGADGLEDLLTALRLVTGRPFDALRPRGYAWVFTGEPLDHILSKAVGDVAHLVATRTLAAGDTATARQASEIGIKADPDSDVARLDLAAVAEAETGSAAADELVAEEVLERVDEHPTRRTQQVIAQRKWLAS